MKFVDEYRDAELGRALSTEIAAIAEPGMRIMSPKQVKITPGWWAMAIPSSTRPIGMTHTGHPGPCTSSTFSGRRSSIPYL